MVTKETDILISGGGIAGLTLGIVLAEAGLDVHLLEPFPPEPSKKIKSSGRTVALMENSLNILKATGVWDEIEPRSCAMKTMRIIDNSRTQNPKIEAPFEASEIGMEQFGFNIPNGLLRAVLFEKAKKTSGMTIHKKKLETFEHTNAQIIATLEGGAKIKASLMVGADGRNSTVRELAGIKADKKSYNQVAITCLINHSKSHEHISTEFHRPSGPLAFVPLPGNQSSVVWVETPENSQAILKLKKSEFEDKLRSLSHDILGGLTLEAGPESWPLCTIKAKALTAPRIALAAEAAHVMSPITAQGLNLSLRDVASLAETIFDAAKLGLDIGSQTTLDKYEKRRRLDVGTRVFGVDAMNKIVSQDIDALKGMRRFGLKAVQKLPGLKRLAMRQGLASTLDQGQLPKTGRLL